MSKIDTTYLDTIQGTNLLTLEEYIYVYPRLMSEYLKLGADCNEMYFIEKQIEQHYLHIDIAKKTQEKILDDRDYKKYGTFEDWVKAARSYDIRIVSLKSIIKFLETKKSELETPKPPTPPEDDQGKAKESPYSVLEWATIFYYADSCKYFNQKNKLEKIDFFMRKHNITTSKNTFKNNFFALKKAINETNTYSIDKLKLILPFVEENYNKGVVKIDNDITLLKDEQNHKSDY